MPVREGFFAFLEDVGAPGSGFGLFGGTHLLMFVLMSALIFAVCRLYSRLGDKGAKTMTLVAALVILGLEIAKQSTFFIIQRRYWPDQLPLHLCGLGIMIELIHAVRPNKTTGEVLYCLCLPGAIAALLFANWSMYPVLNFYCLQSFFIHALHVAFPLMLLVKRKIVPDVKNLWRAALFLTIVLPPVYFVNLRLGTNFFFINAGSAGSPLEIFIEFAGVPGFLLPYAGLLFLVWFLMYLPWVLAERRGIKISEGEEK